MGGCCCDGFNGFGGGSGGGIIEITSLDGSVTITNPTGPTVDLSVAGGGGTPAGPSGAVQFNNAGAFGGSAQCVFVPAAAGLGPSLSMRSSSTSDAGTSFQVKNLAGTVKAALSYTEDPNPANEFSTASGGGALFQVDAFEGVLELKTAATNPVVTTDGGAQSYGLPQYPGPSEGCVLVSYQVGPLMASQFTSGLRYYEQTPGVHTWLEMLGGGGTSAQFVSSPNGVPRSAFGYDSISTKTVLSAIGPSNLRIDNSGVILDWPTILGSPGDVLTRSGPNGLTWAAPSGGGSPGGPVNAIQFNNPLGTFDGDAAATLEEVSAGNWVELHSVLNSYTQRIFHTPSSTNTWELFGGGVTPQWTMRTPGVLGNISSFTHNPSESVLSRAGGPGGASLRVSAQDNLFLQNTAGSLTWPTVAPTIGQELQLLDALGNLGWVAPEALVARIASTGNLGLSGLAAIDGATPIAGDLILAKNQTTASQNGIYVAAAGAWARWGGYNSDIQIRGRIVVVTEGTANRGASFANTNTAAITVGVTNLTYAFTNASTTAGAAVNGAAGAVGTGTTAARSDHTHQVTGGSFSGTALTFGAVADGQVLARSGTSVVGQTPGLGVPSIGASVSSVNVTVLPSSAAYTQLLNLVVNAPTAGSYLIEGMIPIRSETAYGETFDVQLVGTGATAFTTKVATKGGYFFASAGSPNNFEDQIYFRLIVALAAGNTNIGIQIRQQNAGATNRTINPQGFQYSITAQRV